MTMNLSFGKISNEITFYKIFNKPEVLYYYYHIEQLLYPHSNSNSEQLQQLLEINNIKIEELINL